MKKGILFSMLGLFTGILLTGATMYSSASSVMMNVSESKYGFEESIQKFKESTKDKGWKIPTVHDLQATMKKFNKEVKPVMVFELCHPDHAGKILEKNQERYVASLMPCRVAFYVKDDGKTYISRMNSGLMAKTMEGVIPEVMHVAAKETEEILESIIKK